MVKYGYNYINLKSLTCSNWKGRDKEDNNDTKDFSNFSHDSPRVPYRIAKEGNYSIIRYGLGLDNVNDVSTFEWPTPVRYSNSYYVN